MRYWHGLGRCEDHAYVRQIETAEMLGVPVRAGSDPDSANYVHASPFQNVAWAFSALAGGHAICEVDPGGLAVEEDPDFPALGVRFRGPVNVLSMTVINRDRMPNARQVAEILAAGYFYADGSPRYRPDGYLNTPPLWREIGYTDADYKWLGRWYPLDFLYELEDGCIGAITENSEMFVMVPPGHPTLGGRPRIPSGCLLGAWTEPGYYPDRYVVRNQFIASVKWIPGKADSAVRMPWDW